MSLLLLTSCILMLILGLSTHAACGSLVKQGRFSMGQHLLTA